MEEREESAHALAVEPEFSDRFPTETANDLQSVVSRIQTLRPAWGRLQLTYDELQAVSLNASCLLSIGDTDWKLLARFLAARLEKGDPGWQPKSRKQFIESAPDVLQHASNWAYKNGSHKPQTTEAVGVWK